MMKFENTVTLGNVLTAVSMVVAGAGVYASMNERIGRNEIAVNVLKDSDQRHELELKQIRIDSRDVLLEIKSDIREIRGDLKARK